MNRRYKVWFIRKNDHLDKLSQITHIGGLTEDCYRWIISLREAIEGIENGRWQFFVKQNISQLNLIVATSPSGYKYLKTEIDSDIPEHLLNLPIK
ncbi:DUF3892 domain-containing protein [bacterium]|nr:DUF3892 domain-containing protein [bacterium]